MSNAAVFEPLQDAFAGNVEGRELVDAMVFSNEVYAPFTGRGGSGYHSNNIRERYMKQNFLRYYRETEKRLGEAPRVFLKFGANHLATGFSPTNVLTLGTFLREFALLEGVETFSLHLDCQGGLVRDPRSNTTSNCSSHYLGEDSSLAALLPEERMALIDLRKLRPHLGKFADWDEHSHQLIVAYDAVIFVKEVSPATTVGQEHD